MTLNPDTTTIINDGQFRYPVETAALEKWEAENGKITASNYEDFCGAVDHLMPGENPGSPAMVAECERLLSSGASLYRPQ